MIGLHRRVTYIIANRTSTSPDKRGTRDECCGEVIVQEIRMLSYVVDCTIPCVRKFLRQNCVKLVLTTLK